jgi:hypothetical protein
MADTKQISPMQAAYEQWQDYEGIERYREGVGYIDSEFNRNWKVWQAAWNAAFKFEARTRS